MSEQLERQRFALGAAVFVLLLAVGYVGGSFLHRPHPLVIETPTQPTPALARTPKPLPPPVEWKKESKVAVDISGAVLTPGLYWLQPEARIADAIAAAGGVTRDADLSSINRAEKISDGQKIVVPRRGDRVQVSPPPTAPSLDAEQAKKGPKPKKSDATPEVVNLNTATVAELETLPRIGAAMAQRIVDYREKNGPFRSIDDLRSVRGIGAKTLETIRPFLSL